MQTQHEATETYQLELCNNGTINKYKDNTSSKHNQSVRSTLSQYVPVLLQIINFIDKY